MKKTLISFFTFSALYAAQIDGQFEVQNDQGVKIIAIYDTSKVPNCNVTSVDFTGANHITNRALVGIQGLSDPEETHVWSDALKNVSVDIAFKDPLPGQFILRLNHMAYGNNVGQLMSVIVGSKSFALSLRADGASSVFVDLEGVVDATVIKMIPPYPQNAGADQRLLAVAFKTLDVIPYSDEIITAMDEKVEKKKMPWNKQLEKGVRNLRDSHEGKRFLAFLGRGFK